jgi:ankyrin repeat protein/muconolactone delta-isomerase
MIAACRGHDPVVSALLYKKADVYATERAGGTTALHKACQGGNVAVVQKLVEAGAFVDAAAATTGHTPLWDALWYKWPDIVRYLLQKGAGLNTKAYYGFTLEQHIQFEENVNATVEAREKFRQARAAVEARTQADREAETRQELMTAVTKGDLTRVCELLAAGAMVDELAPRVNSFNDNHTPLLVACRDGHTQIAAELIRAGADVNAIDPTFGAVPLHKAVYNGHAPLTHLLVVQPEIDLNFRGATNGYTPLHDALWHGNRDCARILIDAGARLDLRGHDGKLSLDIAVESFGWDDELVAQLRARTTGSGVSERLSASPLDSLTQYYVQMRWNIEGRLSFDELWDLEIEEARWAMTSGPPAQLWKVAGQKRVIGIVSVKSVEELDRIIMGRLPMREYLEFEAIWPLREYPSFVEDAKKRFRV